jgi:hypothetical protein
MRSEGVAPGVGVVCGIPGEINRGLRFQIDLAEIEGGFADYADTAQGWE